MSEYDDTIHIKAEDVVVGDVLLNGGVVTRVQPIGTKYVNIEAVNQEEGFQIYRRTADLVAVREVVTD
jgi:hypothetical protein